MAGGVHRDGGACGAAEHGAQVQSQSVSLPARARAALLRGPTGTVHGSLGVLLGGGGGEGLHQPNRNPYCENFQEGTLF